MGYNSMVYGRYGGFHKSGVSQNGWSIVENPSQKWMMMTEGTPMT